MVLRRATSLPSAPDLHIISLAMQMFVDVTIVDDVFSCDPEALKRACDEKHQNRHLVLYMKRLNDLRLPKKESFDHLRKGKNRHRKG